MARISDSPIITHVSTTLLGRTKLQAVSTGTPAPPVPQPAAVPRPPRPHLAGIRDVKL